MTFDEFKPDEVELTYEDSRRITYKPGTYRPINFPDIEGIIYNRAREILSQNKPMSQIAKELNDE